MKNTVIALVVLIGLATAAIYYMNQKPVTSSPAVPTPIAEEIIPSPTIDPQFQAAASSYSDPQAIYSVLYPNNYKVDNPGEGLTRFYMLGDTQTGQTEMFDGVNVTIEAITLEGKTLEEWVDSRIKEYTDSGMQEVTAGKKPVTLNGYRGYTYSVRGLGESTYTAVQKDASSPHVVVIVYSVQDPQNKGYQKDVDNMISTLQILK